MNIWKMTVYNAEGRIIRMAGEMEYGVELIDQITVAQLDPRTVSIKLEKDVRDG